MSTQPHACTRCEITEGQLGAALEKLKKVERELADLKETHRLHKEARRLSDEYYIGRIAQMETEAAAYFAGKGIK